MFDPLSMMMFNYLSMAFNYESRSVARFTKNDELIVDTCMVTDSAQPYETAVAHKAYGNGRWIVVEMYNSKEEALTGHNKWVSKMTAKELPESLYDVSSAYITTLISNDEWRTVSRR